MMKLGVISDTHGVLRPEVLDYLQGCDYILHAGDIDKQSVLETLQDIAPVYAVRGNNDWGVWADALPVRNRFSLEGVNFFMVHDRYQIPKQLGNVQAVIFGHSHQYFQQQDGGRLWLNPGSCGWPRFGRELTMAFLELPSLHVQRLVLET